MLPSSRCIFVVGIQYLLIVVLGAKRISGFFLQLCFHYVSTLATTDQLLDTRQ